MNKLWVYTIVFYVRKGKYVSMREFKSFPFSTYEKASEFRKKYQDRKTINKNYPGNNDYHWESIIEEVNIDEDE